MTVDPNSVGQFLKYAGFAVGHWYFAHAYYKMPEMVPYLRDENKIPENITKANLRRDRIMVALNLAPAVGIFVSRSGVVYQDYIYYVKGVRNPPYRRYNMWQDIYTSC